MKPTFLFITHLTPVAKRSPLREELFFLMQKSLENQTYPHWKALWIGEKEQLVTPRILEVDASEKNKLQSIYLRKDVLQWMNDAEYLVKLDDDDLILPRSLEYISGKSFDICYDRWHTFFDIVTGSLTRQKRTWMASTCIHRKEHAIRNPYNHQPSENFIHSVFYSDHSKTWHVYYRNKRMLPTSHYHPLYVRVLSPTSITARFNGSTYDNMENYFNYLTTFGSWFRSSIKDFDFLYENLIGIRRKYFPHVSEKKISAPVLRKWKEYFQYNLFSWIS